MGAQTCPTVLRLSLLSAQRKHRGDDDCLECRGGRLRLHIKGPDGFDILTKKLDTSRVGLPWGEHVENPPA